MEWTEEQKKNLLLFANSIDSDNIKVKKRIKQVLLDNPYIIHVLHNEELEQSDAEPDEYYDVNILPYYMISPTQSNVQNFVCFTCNFKETQRYNKSMKYLQIVFVVLCNNKNIKDEETGVARHDLLGALIQDQFNFQNYFGQKIQLVEDTESIVDGSYACRTMIFEQITDNNLVKTKNGVPILANKRGETLGGRNSK